MEKETLADYEKAGKIAKQAREFAKTLLVEDALLLDIADKIENKIIKLGGKPAFPVNLSVNEIAAHYAPTANETTKLKKSDLIKVDIGVHINGFVADTAFSYSIGKSEENEKLITTANAALSAALKLVKPGVLVSEIGSAIAKEVNSVGLQPIRNLMGHSVDEYDAHTDPNIPNYNNGSNIELEKDMAIAIEPFVTSGEGMVIEGKTSEIFELERPGTVRTGREILAHIAEEYKTLPFAKRWLIKKFGIMKTNLFLREAVAKGILRDYKVLREKTEEKVAQAEHTIIIADKPIIITL